MKHGIIFITDELIHDESFMDMLKRDLGEVLSKEESTRYAWAWEILIESDKFDDVKEGWPIPFYDITCRREGGKYFIEKMEKYLLPKAWVE